MGFLIIVFALVVSVAICLVGVFFLIKILKSLSPELAHNMSWASLKPHIAKLRQSLALRIVMVALLAGLMTIPLSMLQTVVNERNERYNNVLDEISATWGGPQVVSGPMLTIPYTESWITEEWSENTKGEKIKNITNHEQQRYFVALPEVLDIQTKLSEDFRKRGIYSSLVYNTDFNLQGHFEIPALENPANHTVELHYDKAFVSMGLSDIKAIEHISPLQWNNGESFAFDPGLRVPISSLSFPTTYSHNNYNGKANYTHVEAASPAAAAVDAAASASTDNSAAASPGFHAKIDGLKVGQSKYPFSIQFKAKGSYGLNFAPFGRTTTVTIKSTWPHPSFKGAVLPKSHQISSNGFEATWQVPSVARNFPQYFSSDEAFNLSEFIAGVDLVEPVNLYSQVERAVKYGLLFIGLTFLTFVLFEIKRPVRERLHWIQYVVIGGALSLFYLTLLSLAEQLQFAFAYVIASAITAVMIAIYVWIATRNALQAGLVTVLLVALYSILYALLNLEDYALMMGTVLLIIMLAVVMYITRGINRATDAP